MEWTPLLTTRASSYRLFSLHQVVIDCILAYVSFNIVMSCQIMAAGTWETWGILCDSSNVSASVATSSVSFSSPLLAETKLQLITFAMRITSFYFVLSDNHPHSSNLSWIICILQALGSGWGIYQILKPPWMSTELVLANYSCKQERGGFHNVSA